MLIDGDWQDIPDIKGECEAIYNFFSDIGQSVIPYNLVMQFSILPESEMSFSLIISDNKS